MKSGETSNNNKNQEQYDPAEDLQYVKNSATISELRKLGIKYSDLSTMDAPAMHDLRTRIEQSKAIPPTPEDPVLFPDTPANPDVPVLFPDNPADIPPQPAFQPQNIAPTESIRKKPEAKTGPSARLIKIGAAVVSVAAAALIIFGVGTTAKAPGEEHTVRYEPRYETPAAPQETEPQASDAETENSSEEFQIPDTDYRNLLLNTEGTDYNPNKESRYAVATPFPEEYYENNDKEGAIEELLSRLCKQPESIAGVASIIYSTGDDAAKTTDYMERLGASGTSAYDMEKSIMADDNSIEWAKEGMRDILLNETESFEFGTADGYGYSFYLYSDDPIQNNTDNIHLARSQIKDYTGDRIMTQHLKNGATVVWRFLCGGTQPLVITEEQNSSHEEDIEPGIPVIGIDIDEPNKDTGNENGTGEETGTETSDETDEKLDDETLIETDDDSNDDPDPTPDPKPDPSPDPDTGTETGTETGDETGLPIPTGVETGNETGLPIPTGLETGLEEKDPVQVEQNMQTGEESTNTIVQTPELTPETETKRPSPESVGIYDYDSNQFIIPDTEMSSETTEAPAEITETPVKDTLSEDGSGNTVAETIEEADQEYTDDTNLSTEDQSDTTAQAAADAGEITNNETLTQEESANRFAEELGGGGQ